MIEEILESLKSIDLSWPKKYIIRYIYIKISIFFRRDLNYFLATEEEQLELYKLGFKKEGFNIVCSSLADYYVDIFSIFNIRATKIVATNTAVPLFSLIVESDEEIYYLDPLNDLARNQYGLETGYFAIIPNYENVRKMFNLSSISSDILRTMDTELGLQSNGIYVSDFVKRLRQEMVVESKINRIYDIAFTDKYSTIKKKLEIIESKLINLGHVKGLYERMLVYNYLRGQLFNKCERKVTEMIIDKDKMELQFVLKFPSLDREVYVEEQSTSGQHYLKKR